MLLMSLDDIRPGMVLGIGLRNSVGHTLLGPGIVLTDDYVDRLRRLGYCAVWIDDDDTRDIVPQDTLSERTRIAATKAIRETFLLTSREIERLRETSAENIRTILESHHFQRAFKDEGLVERLVGQVDELVGEALDRAVLTGLGSLRTHSSYHYQHSLDVAVTATLLGRVLGLNAETLKKLAVGCMLHDIGCLFVDPGILDKPGRLDERELARIREHPIIGYLFIRDSLQLGAMIAHIAYQHHERQDGAGYPRALRGSNRLVAGAEVHLPGRITPLAEIAAIADFHDACSSDRPHRPRLPYDEVWRMLGEAGGSHLNREMVGRLLNVLPPYPQGTLVAVISGRWKGYRGVVVKVHTSVPARPVIRLIRTVDGGRMEPVELDLRSDDSRVRGLIALDPSPVPAATPS